MGYNPARPEKLQLSCIGRNRPSLSCAQCRLLEPAAAARYHNLGGKLLFHLFASLVEFERNLMYERTSAGLGTALAHGHKGDGRKGSKKKSGKRPWRSNVIRSSVANSSTRLLGSCGLLTTNRRELRSKHTKQIVAASFRGVLV